MDEQDIETVYPRKLRLNSSKDWCTSILNTSIHGDNTLLDEWVEEKRH